MQPVLYPQDVEARRPQIMPVLEREQIELMRSFGGPPRRFAPGELVIAAGAPTPIFVVLEGSIDVIRNDGLGNELLIKRQVLKRQIPVGADCGAQSAQ